MIETFQFFTVQDWWKNWNEKNINPFDLFVFWKLQILLIDNLVKYYDIVSADKKSRFLNQNFIRYVFQNDSRFEIKIFLSMVVIAVGVMNFQWSFYFHQDCPKFDSNKTCDYPTNKNNIGRCIDCYDEIKDLYFYYPLPPGAEIFWGIVKNKTIT